ncbi:MAG: nucleotidyltransferase [Candidatus Omnitrophica bacterium]|nr:nucleotidyltransferase [Candidatus Omnitrophota bacterium]MBU4590762.1 nucleotidyltransferase [Candidatus Omnitrophota bacterium]
MKYPTIFHLISDVFNKKNTDAVLIGGFAVNYYKVSRQTADIDFLITKDGFDEISVLLEKEGYKKDYSQDVFAKLSNSQQYLMDIDFMFVDIETLTRIIKDAKEITIAKQKFMVPSLNHLIALKLHSLKFNPKIRENRDLPDIIELVRVNKVNVKDRDFKEVCLKFGTEELYSRILNRM